MSLTPRQLGPANLAGVLTLTLLAGSAAASAPLAAHSAVVTVSPSPALWHETITITVTGVGCSGPAWAPALTAYGSDTAIEVDIDGCAEGSTEPFRLEVQIADLPRGRYQVHAHDAQRHQPADPPPVAPLGVAELAVSTDASLAVDLPAVALSGRPIPIVLSGLATSACYLLDEPIVAGNVVSATFADECLLLPPGGPHVFELETTIEPLPGGSYTFVFYDATYRGEVNFDAYSFVRRQFEVRDPPRCIPGPTTLCLGNGRYRVEATWADEQFHHGSGHPIPLPERDDSGLFWFFDPANIELTVKVLDGCAANGHNWVFLSSGSNVEYEVLVTDTVAGINRTYRNDLGDFAALVHDTAAFPCQ